VNCAANGMIEALQKQNEELQQRVARLEALVAKK
jgi:cell division protein FtsB